MHNNLRHFFKIEALLSLKLRGYHQFYEFQ